MSSSRTKRFTRILDWRLEVRRAGMSGLLLLPEEVLGIRRDTRSEQTHKQRRQFLFLIRLSYKL